MGEALAAVVEVAGAPPALRRVPEPRAGSGRALVRVLAAGLNPVDLSIGAGRFYMPVPEPPFVAGAEAVGEVLASSRLPPGTRAWCLGMTGCWAEVAAVPEEAMVPVPDGLPDDLAVALGIAGLAGWMPVRARGGLRAGETVVVLGAGGVVGQLAVQAARLGGAGWVVAAARSASGRRRALERGADAAVPTGEGLAGALAEACGAGADLVVDTLWGEAALAAIGVLRRGGRLVQVGSAAAPRVEVAAGPLRGGRLDLRGFSVFSEAPADRARAYRELAGAAARGEVALARETLPLEEAPAAWERQAAGTEGVKILLVPRRGSPGRPRADMAGA